MAALAIACSNEPDPEPDAGGGRRDLRFPDGGLSGKEKVGGACEPNEFEYKDFRCNTDGGPGQFVCHQRGDQSCYPRCSGGSSCTDPLRPRCVQLWLSDGNNELCVTPEQVCSDRELSTCL